MSLIGVCSIDYSIFIVCLSYIYPIFIIYLSYVVICWRVGLVKSGERKECMGG